MALRRLPPAAHHVVVVLMSTAHHVVVVLMSTAHHVVVVLMSASELVNARCVKCRVGPPHGP
jgi:hypothetical protein